MEEKKDEMDIDLYKKHTDMCEKLKQYCTYFVNHKTNLYEISQILLINAFRKVQQKNSELTKDIWLETKGGQSIGHYLLKNEP